MSKEAARISKLIQLNKVPTFVTTVTVNNSKEMMSCIEKIHDMCPDTVVVISASIIKTNTLIVGTAFPVDTQIANFLGNSIASVSAGEPIFTDGKTPQCRVVEISYPIDSEQYAFKNVDVVNGIASSLLKKAGLYQEESSEEEYGLDI